MKKLVEFCSEIMEDGEKTPEQPVVKWYYFVLSFWQYTIFEQILLELMSYSLANYNSFYIHSYLLQFCVT